MFAIAQSELRMLVRNRLVAACAILIPLALGAFFIFSGNEGAGAITAVLVVMIMVSMGVYITATTTLAARRQTLFLKRLRSGVVSDAGIIAGLVAPIVAISVVQVSAVLAVLAFTDEPPQVIWPVVVGVLLAEVMFTGLALATAGVTNSPEHAQVTTLPFFFLSVGVSMWVVFTGVEELAWVKRALPGGGVTELILAGWSGGDIHNALVLILPSLAWAAIAVFAARSMFRWEPRA